MDLINNYFNKTVFEKVDQKETFIIYAARITSSLGSGQKQYVLAFVPVEHAIKNKAYLYELAWHNVQTRLLRKGYNLVQQKWDMPRNLPNIIFDKIERNKQYTKYIYLNEGEPVFEMILLHDPKKQSRYQYYDRMDIVASLNTFSCVLNYVGSVSPMLYTSDKKESQVSATNSLDNNPQITYL